MTKYGNLPEEWIASYASGQLSDAKSLFVATHITYHPELQDTLQKAEAIGGNLIENSDTAELAPDALEHVFARIDSLPADEVAAAKLETSSAFDTPPPLAKHLQKNLSDLKWRFMGPGMSQVKLWQDDNGDRLWLLRAKGGTEMPVHDHRGTELTMVLQGSYTVEGVRFGPGEVEIADSSTENHRPMIDEGEDCICLVVTDAPIRLHSVVGRLFQPFIGL